MAVVLAACGPDELASQSQAELSLTATELVYDTTRLEVVAGQPVKLTLNNDGAIVHDFSIMEMPHTGEVMAEEMEDEMAGHDMSQMTTDPEIHVVAPVGGSGSIEFTPSTPGEYEFFCSEAGHKDAGMVGTLVVKAP